MNTILQQPIDDSIRDYYKRFVDLGHFVISHTADRGADIAARALPIMAPLPNAVSIYHISITEFKYEWWQALAFAGTLEIALFALFEIALMLWNGVLEKWRLYIFPFVMMLVVCGRVLYIIIAITRSMENAHPAISMLPWLSAAGAVGLAFKRWHERNLEEQQTQRRSKKTKRTKGKTSIIHKDVQNGQRADNLDVARQEKKMKDAQRVNVRQSTILDIVIGHQTIGVSDIIQSLPDNMKAGRSTINDDLKSLESQGKVYNKDRKWHSAKLPDLGIPQHEPAEPYTNGVHA